MCSGLCFYRIAMIFGFLFLLFFWDFFFREVKAEIGRLIRGLIAIIQVTDGE